MTDAWTCLRQATREAHERIEKLPAMARLFAPGFRRDELAALLGHLLSVHRPLERLLAADDEMAAIGYRPRTPLLEADLGKLHGSEAAAPSSLPAYSTGAARLGALYVLEGSAIGGQLIRRHLVAAFGQDFDECLSFYRPYGDSPSGQWQRFRQYLLDHVVGEDALMQAKEGALATFGLFHQSLSNL